MTFYERCIYFLIHAIHFSYLPLCRLHLHNELVIFDWTMISNYKSCLASLKNFKSSVNCFRISQSERLLEHTHISKCPSKAELRFRLFFGPKPKLRPNQVVCWNWPNPKPKLQLVTNKCNDVKSIICSFYSVGKCHK